MVVVMTMVVKMMMEPGEGGRSSWKAHQRDDGDGYDENTRWGGVPLEEPNSESTRRSRIKSYHFHFFFKSVVLFLQMGNYQTLRLAPLNSHWGRNLGMMWLSYIKGFKINLIRLRSDQMGGESSVRDLSGLFASCAGWIKWKLARGGHLKDIESES